MNVVFLGLSGAGKTTQAELAQDNFDIGYVSSSDSIEEYRDAPVDPEGYRDSEGVMTLGEYVKKGNQLPTETITGLVEESIQSLDNEDYILDGFPRTRAQSEELESIDPLDHLLHFEADTATVVERLEERGRHDDDSSAIENRLGWQKQGIEETLAFYRERETEIEEIDARKPVDEVWEETKEYLKEKGF